MTEATETPEAFVERMSRGADRRRQESLRLILEACDRLRTTGSKTVTVDAIGQLSSRRGGPGARAIRNNTGSGLAYQRLIEIYREHHGLGAKPGASLVERDRLLHGVRDPGVRARIDHLLHENRRLTGEVRLLKHLAAQTAHVTLVPSEGGDAEIPEAVLGRVLSGRLKRSQLDALRTAFDERRVREAGWVIDERGRVWHGNREVLPIGFVGAIQAVVAMVEGACSDGGSSPGSR